MTRMLVVLQLAACAGAPPSGEDGARTLFVAGLDFDPPESPAHDDEETDEHARGSENPFLCAGGNVDCSVFEGRPEDDTLSCDAAGCHGDTEYGVTPEADRHLLGSDGPSCLTCHGEEWE